MNREETKKAIAVMQAYVDGEEIEYGRYEEKPTTIATPLWNWDVFNYQVKQKPREYWLADGTAYLTIEQAYKAVDIEQYGGEIIHVREVEK